MSRFVIKPITMTFENGGDFKIDIFSNFSRSWYLLLCKLNIPPLVTSSIVLAEGGSSSGCYLILRRDELRLALSLLMHALCNLYFISSKTVRQSKNLEYLV